MYSASAIAATDQDVPPSTQPAPGVTTPPAEPPAVMVPLPLPPVIGKEDEDKKKDDKTAPSPENPPAPPPPGTPTVTLPSPPETEQPIPPPASLDTPIVPDAEFEAALPTLDGGEGLPEGTIQAEGTAAQELAPVGTPEDAELAESLAPLEGYDVQPVQTATAPETPPSISYSTRVTGLKPIGQDGRFKDLSALESGDGKAANAAMVRARANEDQALAVRLMKSAGYYDGKVTTTITAPATEGQPVAATLTALPGTPYKLGDIRIDAQPTVPESLIRDALPLRAGDVISANSVLAAEANVGVVLPRNGYPFAKVGARDIVLDPQTHIGDYTLKVDTGNRSRFGKVTTDGDKAFDADHIAVLTRFDQGDLYDSRMVDDLREALVSTSLFRTVSVESTPTGAIDGEGVETVDLVVHQNAGPARTLSAEVGFATGQGATAEGTWTHRNFFPPEGALIAHGVIGTQEQGLDLTYRRSNFKRRDLTLALAVSADHQIYDAYQAYTTGFTGSLARVSTPIWQKEWTWSLGLELLASREKATIANTTLAAFETYYLANIPARLGFDQSDDLLNPTKGYRLALQGGPQFSLSGSASSTFRTVFDASYYKAFGAKIVLATRARVGSLTGGTTANIAPSRRLYAGGGGSVRGFAYQGLGPLDATGDPTGGRSLFEASAEVRYRWGDWGVVPFVDVGQVYDAQFPDFSDMRVGIGVGARLYSNFGPIRIDVATPLDRRTDEPQFALYVGIGQAF